MIALVFAAIAILAIAWINYINLTVARSMERAREVGVRRVVGAFRKQLIHQFLFEALVACLQAYIFAGYESDCFYIGGRADRADSSVL